ncbi:MAG: glycosyltransferase family 9 protein [Planctomycetota bacterium]|nr:glycosyltransferase family 9 protein [Planctomycetota bacterium]
MIAHTSETPRILIVRLSAVGDCLHAVPVLTALRERYPKGFIGWAIEDAALSLMNGHPMVDKFHRFPRKAFKHKQGSIFERMALLQLFRRELKDERYEIAIDLQGLTKSGLVAWWSGARHRVGFRGKECRELNRLFVNRRVNIPDSCIHIVDKNLALLSELGIEPPARPHWAMPGYRDEDAEMEAFLGPLKLGRGAGRKPFAIVNPGATWLTKRWPPERFGEVARGLVERHGIAVVSTWAGAEEKAAAQRIVQAAGRDAHMAPDTNLRQLAALTGRADLFVGNDTGPLHLAVAMGVHCVAVFGASDPLRNGPFGREHRIQAGGPECQPCWKTSCHRGDLACLHWVTPEKVLESCAKLLAQAREVSA